MFECQNAENCQRKKTRQRRGNGCRGGRDAVGVAAKCRGADQYGGRGGCGKGRRGTFGRQGETGTRYAQFCRVSVTLSLLLSSYLDTHVYSNPLTG